MDKKTPLYDTHLKYGGKIVEFGGFLLPVQYGSGVKAEHMAVRTQCGLFDVSHMGEVLVQGEKAKDFLQRAFSVILIATIAVWFLQSFDLKLNMVDDAGDSILAKIAGVFAPIMKPVGLGDWRILVALISGFMAKESVVSTLKILYSGDVTSAMSSLTAACLLVFSLLYTPCVAAIAAVKRELGKKWALAEVVWQCAVAWLATLVIRAILLLIGVV